MSEKKRENEDQPSTSSKRHCAKSPTKSKNGCQPDDSKDPLGFYIHMFQDARRLRILKVQMLLGYNTCLDEQTSKHYYCKPMPVDRRPAAYNEPMQVDHEVACASPKHSYDADRQVIHNSVTFGMKGITAVEASLPHDFANSLYEAISMEFSSMRQSSSQYVPASEADPRISQPYMAYSLVKTWGTNDDYIYSDEEDDTPLEERSRVLTSTEEANRNDWPHFIIRIQVRKMGTQTIEVSINFQPPADIAYFHRIRRKVEIPPIKVFYMYNNCGKALFLETDTYKKKDEDQPSTSQQFPDFLNETEDRMHSVKIQLQYTADKSESSFYTSFVILKTREISRREFQVFENEEMNLDPGRQINLGFDSVEVTLFTAEYGIKELRVHGIPKRNSGDDSDGSESSISQSTSSLEVSK